MGVWGWALGAMHQEPSKLMVTQKTTGEIISSKFGLFSMKSFQLPFNEMLLGMH